MSRRKPAQPQQFVAEKNRARNKALDEVLMHTHINSHQNRRMSDAEFERQVMNLHMPQHHSA